MDLQLNEKLSVDDLSQRYSQDQRIRIDHWLKPHSANAIAECLSGDIPWSLAFIENDDVRKIPIAQAHQLPVEEQSAIMRNVYRTALDRFQFLYEAYNPDDDNAADVAPDHPFFQALEFLRSPEVLAQISRISGVAGLNHTTIQASRFQPGHFLLGHDDTAGETSRELAFVVNLARDWRIGWGGLLQFHDANSNVEQAYLPRYNSLSLFRVPAVHSVSCVTPFAGEPRIALSGWFEIR